MISHFYRRVNSIFCENKFIVFCALVVSLAVFFFVKSQIQLEDGETFLEVKKQIVLSDFVQIPEGWFIIGETKQEITLSLAGGKEKISKLNSKDLKFKDLNVNMEGLETEKELNLLLKITQKNIDVPFGVSIKKINPDSIDIRLEQKEKRQLKVSPQWAPKERLPDGYGIVKAETFPVMIDVSGPASLLAGYTEMKTLPIHIQDITNSFDVRQRILPVKGLQIQPQEVLVKVEVRRIVQQRNFRGLPVSTFGFLQRNFHFDLIDAPKADITVKGPSNILSGLQSNDIKLFIDAAGIRKTGIFSAKISCWLGKPGLSVVHIVPQTLKIKVTQ